MPKISVFPPGMSMDIETAIRLSAQAFEKHDLVYGHGTADSLDEASWLILHALALSPLQAPDYSQTLSNRQLEQCDAIVTRRIVERIPAAYITGTAWFAGLSFRADARALVPRSPLAEFILNDFFGLKNPLQVDSVLDLCTGGGCIAIACAVQLPHAQVEASDLSRDALSLAADNVADHQLQGRVTLLESALFEKLTGSYDLIISNPPYVDDNDIREMGKEFEHEPKMGLAAGDDGLDLVRVILNQAADYMNDDALLVVEVGNSAQALENAYPNVPFLWLEFDNGGTGVFALTREQLSDNSETFYKGLKQS